MTESPITLELAAIAVIRSNTIKNCLIRMLIGSRQKFLKTSQKCSKCSSSRRTMEQHNVLQFVAFDEHC